MRADACPRAIEDYMYLRFVSPVPANRARGAYGLFQAALSVVYDPKISDEVYAPLREELDWFNDNLPAPSDRHFRVKSRRRWRDEGICWFRAEAREVIAHAHILAGLLYNHGVIIARLHTRTPGQILYRDDYQIVAKPCEATPVHWH